MERRIQLEHPDSARSNTRIRSTMYWPVRRTLLEIIGEEPSGVPFSRLSAQLARRLPSLFEDASPGWYTTSVNLDLEARGLVERVTGSRPVVLRLSPAGRRDLARRR